MLRQHPDNSHICLSIPKTTIGSADCELLVEGPEVAPQHLVIEKRSSSDYILHDLGTSEGTYVNQCRVSGASVKLNCGDIIKLGPNSPAFTFLTPSGGKPEFLVTPTITGPDSRASSAPTRKVDHNGELLTNGQRTHSAILTGRSTMKRKVLNGIPPPASPDKNSSSVLEVLQKTVSAQEGKLTALSDELQQFRRCQPDPESITKLEREIDSLRHGENAALFKLEKQKSEVQTANAVLSGLQSELQERDKRIDELSTQIETSNRDKNANNGTVVTLRRQLAEREAELRHVRAEFNSFRVKPDELKEQNLIFVKENKCLRKQIRDAKREGQEGADKVAHLERDLAELQTKLAHETRMHVQARDMVGKQQAELTEKGRLEKLLKLEVKEADVKLRNHEARLRENLSKVSDGEEGELLDRLAQFVSTHLETKTNLSKTEEELAILRTGYETVHGDLAKVELETLSLLELVQEQGASDLSSKVSKEGDKIAALEIADNLNWLQGAILTMVRSIEKLAGDLESREKTASEAAKVTSISPDIGANLIVESLKEKALALGREKAELEVKLTNTVDNYEQQLALQHKTLTGSQREEMASLKRVHEEQMRALYVSEQEKQDGLIKEQSRERAALKDTICGMESEIRKLKTGCEESGAKVAELESLVEELRNSEKTSKLIEESLRSKISKFDTDTLELRERCTNQGEKMTALESETESLREQNRQYAVTIVSMENRLHTMSGKCTDLETNLTTSIAKLNGMPAPPPEPYEVIRAREEDLRKDIQRLTTLANTLRREYGLAKAEADQRAVQIQGLRCDLAGAAARLSDMSGELSEAQKLEMEAARERAEKQELTIAEQIATIEGLKKELGVVKKKLANVPERLPAKTPPKVQIEYREKEMTAEEKDTFEKGHKCVNERHSIIIDKQRLALAELREEIKKKSPTLPEPVEGSQQVGRLKKELNELRTALKTRDAEWEEKESDLKNKARQLNTTTEKNADLLKHLKGELNDTQRLLGHSEACFSSLATEIRANLNQPQPPIPALTVAHLDQCLQERAMMTADLGAEIVAISTRLSQKDIILSSYQDDLSQLRACEVSADTAETDAALLRKKLAGLQEETSTLRKTITHLKGELDQQQRVNTALVQRNAAKNGVGSEPTLAHHHCPDPRTESQIELIKRQHQEEIKRKNYDIKKLKEELATG